MSNNQRKANHPTRREAMGYGISALYAVSAWTIGSAAQAHAASKLQLNIDGLYTESWMRSPGPDLAALFSEGLKEGKYSAIMWENRGCPVCKVVHRDVMSKAEVAHRFTSVFNVYQLNVRGMRTYDIPAYGRMSEMDLSRVQYVRGTPTLIMYGSQQDHSTGLPIEVARLQGRFSIDQLFSEIAKFG